MTHSRIFRVLFIGSLTAISLGLAGITGWLLWPEWQKHRAVSSLIEMVKRKEAYVRNPTESGQPYNVVRLANAELDAVKSVNACDDAMSSLISLLKDKDDEVVWNAVQAIDQLDLYASGAVPAFREALYHRNAYVQVAAVRGLMYHEPDGTDAIPVLIELIDNQEQSVRRWAITTLSCFPTTGSPAVPRLVEAAKDEDHFVRAAAASTLCSIGRRDGPNRAIGMSVLKVLLRDEDKAVADEARHLMWQVDPAVVPLQENSF